MKIPRTHLYDFGVCRFAILVLAAFGSAVLPAPASVSRDDAGRLVEARPLDSFVQQFAQSLAVEDISKPERQAGRPNVATARFAPHIRTGNWLSAPPLATVAEDGAEPKAKAGNAVEWIPLLRQSAFFLGVQHGFRIATEEGTREGLKGPFFRDWYRSLSSLHGWGDGDPFLVNYVGHPMQGSVSGFIWRQNDPRYRSIEFGNNADYWRSVLRSTAFSFAYSSQFEIGPVSEATIGAVQSRFPQQGFVDHVATPTIGALWMIGEDVLDRYVIRKVEGRTENVFIRMMARGWLNPSRSFANMMRLKVPWWRDSRPGIWKYRMEEERVRREAERRAARPSPLRQNESGGKPWDAVAPFHFTFSTDYSRHPAGGVGANCIGGGGTAVWNRGRIHSWVAQVSGCKLFTFAPDFSGDILIYRAGPRWTKRNGRWMPYGQVLLGGKRATIENIPEDRREEVRRIDQLPASQRPPRSQYVDRQQVNGIALSVGGGLDMGLTRAAFLRVANVDYTHAWVPSGTIASYPNSVRFSMGIVLRVGNW